MSGIRQYAVVTGAYWAFTVTDGALRMLVLLHLAERGFDPLALATLFVGYEVFGVLTNLAGGWIGARAGLRATLLGGLGLQIVALAMLAADPSLLTIAYVMASQILSGVAKDLTKMSAKSWIKLVVPDGDAGGLMRWVSRLTGSKNALKGAGFFVGGVLLGAFGFRAACVALAGLVAAALVVSLAMLPRAAGRARGGAVAGLVSRDARVNWLAAARLFLFGSRDAWFVVALPLFFAETLAWSHGRVGAFLAAWVIVYGVVQASAPRWVGAPDATRLSAWTFALAVPLGAVVLGLRSDVDAASVLTVGLYAFAVVFAANSAIHSFLIVHYAAREEVAQRVGFYYASNAAGRLAGTLLSGSLYQAGGGGRDGLVAALLAALALVAVSGALCLPLRSAERVAA